MTYYIVIPAHNEAAFIKLTLDSLAAQTILPAQVVVVDDHSTDATAEIVREFAQNHSWLQLLQTQSEAVHLPGSKVIRAFEKGLAVLDDAYDFIVKLDADLILPTNYFERVIQTFQADAKTGMAGGFAYIEKNGSWILENLTDKDHIRGAFKAYRKELFQQMNGLRTAMGWDTADELLAKYYGWNVVTLPDLKVKHLKPTGANYNKAARYKQGAAFYSLGYGFTITAIASGKLAWMKRKPLLFLDYMAGYFKAVREKTPMLVNADQARFVRAYRWKKMREKLF